MADREKLIELLKTIPQVNHAQAAVEGLDYVFGCAADHLIANGVTVRERRHWNTLHFVKDTPFGYEVPDKYVCSACMRIYYTKSNFCPDCGADMRGEQDAVQQG